MNASQAAADHLRGVTRQPDVGKRLRAVAARNLATCETRVAQARLTPAQRHLRGLERPMPGDLFARQLKTLKMFETPKVAFTVPSLESFFSQQRGVLGSPKLRPLARNAIRDATGPSRDFSGLIASSKGKSVGLLATDHLGGAARAFITPRIADTWRHDLVGGSKPLHALAASTWPGAAGGFMGSRTKDLKLLEAHIQGLSNVTAPTLAASRLTASLRGLRPVSAASFAAGLAGPNIGLSLDPPFLGGVLSGSGSEMTS